VRFGVSLYPHSELSDEVLPKTGAAYRKDDEELEPISK
jgi:hypothetical protein